MSGNPEFISPNVLHQDNGLPLPERGVVLSKHFEVLLTQEQFKQLQKFMPSGYSLVQSKSSKIATRKQLQPPPVSFSEEPTLRTQLSDKGRRDAFNKAERKIKEPMEFTKRCEYLLSLLKKHRFGYPFSEPVDPEVLGIPDYFDVIKEPMDFSKIDKRLRNGFYKTQGEFENDVNKIWDNALTYNKPNTEIYHMTIEIKDYFNSLIKEDEGPTSLPHSKPRSQKQPKSSDLDSSEVVFKTSKPVHTNKGGNLKPLSYQEKKVLAEMIRQLPSESLWEVWEIVSPYNQNQEEEIEFEIDTLSPAVARQLEELVRSKQKTLTNKKTKPKNPPVFRESQQSAPTFDRTATSQNGVVASQNANTVSKVAQNSSVTVKETVGVTNPKETKVNKEESDSDSFLENLSESDD